MRLVAKLGGESPTVLGLDGLESPAKPERRARRQDRHREVEAVPVVALDRVRRQSGHRRIGLPSMVLEDARAQTPYRGSPRPGDRSSSFTSLKPPAAPKELQTSRTRCSSLVSSHTATALVGKQRF